MTKPNFDKLDRAISEAQAFIREAQAFKLKRLKAYYPSWAKGKATYDKANQEHGTLVHRSILLAKYLVAWRR